MCCKRGSRWWERHYGRLANKLKEPGITTRRQIQQVTSVVVEAHPQTAENEQHHRTEFSLLWRWHWITIIMLSAAGRMAQRSTTRSLASDNRTKAVQGAQTMEQADIGQSTPMPMPMQKPLQVCCRREESMKAWWYEKPTNESSSMKSELNSDAMQCGQSLPLTQ